ncbi:hypothetical protein Pst134EA_015794 [Puccinia striiformis f. sp. tritici]|uniref:hypothetical protein n=1 Tax=Puccinia striiformis f. sp. tritici TaxID=168172 RepID=UPI0020082DE5|nr:hypothetical protein Pst134EA_015794 [Puccinia striiformis f. sp. tritici]KAH9452946.1 hypothetical protein Pst134EB_016887 [Puccinia striiformis f. sp. tritici]KAH9463708.1 hypothetical protein Pst134EA_015794 [Puccinia striiformis f. sp. tritici]
MAEQSPIEPVADTIASFRTTDQNEKSEPEYKAIFRKAIGQIYQRVATHKKRTLSSRMLRTPISANPYDLSLTGAARFFDVVRSDFRQLDRDRSAFGGNQCWNSVLDSNNARETPKRRRVIVSNPEREEEAIPVDMINRGTIDEIRSSNSSLRNRITTNQEQSTISEDSNTTKNRTINIFFSLALHNNRTESLGEIDSTYNLSLPIIEVSLYHQYRYL